MALYLSALMLLSGALLLVIMRRRAARDDLLRERLALLQRPVAGLTEGGLQTWKKQLDGRSERHKLTMLLQQAGFRSAGALRGLIAAKIVLAVLLAVASFFLLPQDGDVQQLLFAFIAMFVGSLLPEQYLRQRADAVAREIARTIPDAIDLLVICLESGMTIDRAFKRVGGELGEVAPDLSRELTATEAELQLMPERERVFEALVQRVPIREMEQLVLTLVQAERFGSPVAPTLRQLAADTRQMQQLELEERLGRVPARMGLPLMLLIMFPLVVLIAAPPVISLMRNLQ